MDRLLSITSSPPVSVIVLPDGRSKLIRSPGAASAIAWRKVPGPLSSVFVTVSVFAAGGAAAEDFAATLSPPPAARGPPASPLTFVATAKAGANTQATNALHAARRAKRRARPDDFRETGV